MLIELQQHGQDEYIGWEMKVCCRADDIVNRLGEQAKTMERDLKDWRSAIRQQRNNFYHLNYFTTHQLLSLREELGCFKETTDKHIKPEIMALLLSVSRGITTQIVKDWLFDIRNIIGEQTSLDQLSSEEYEKSIQGSLTHKANYNDLNSLSRSNNPSIKKASSASKSIVILNNDIPDPLLTIEDLTDNQKTILANVKQDFSFRTKLVLLAFDRCAEADDEDVVAEWCNERAVDFPYPDSDEETASTISYDDDDDRDSITSDSPSHTTMDCEVPHILSKITEPDSKQKINAKIRIRNYVAIDEDHPTVIDLVEAGFDLEQSIKAASKYPDDPSAAIDYLDDSNIEEGGTLFQSSATAEELFGESSSGMTVVEPIVHSDGFGLEEESVPVLFTQRQDSSMSNTSQTL